MSSSDLPSSGRSSAETASASRLSGSSSPLSLRDEQEMEAAGVGVGASGTAPATVTPAAGAGDSTSVMSFREEREMEAAGIGVDAVAIVMPAVVPEKPESGERENAKAEAKQVEAFNGSAAKNRERGDEQARGRRIRGGEEEERKENSVLQTMQRQAARRNGGGAAAKAVSGEKDGAGGCKKQLAPALEKVSDGRPPLPSDVPAGVPLPEKMPSLPPGDEARYGRAVSSVGGGSGGEEIAAVAAMETVSAPSPDGRGGSNFRISTTRGAGGFSGSGVDGAAPSATNPEHIEAEEVGFEESVLGNESSEEAGSSGSRTQADGASSAVPHFDAVLAEGRSNRPVPRDQSRDGDETIRRRMIDVSPLIEGEHVLALGSGDEQGFEDERGNSSGFWCDNRTKMGGVLAALLLIIGVSVIVVFGRGRGDGNVTESGVIQQPPVEPQPSLPPSMSTAAQSPTTSMATKPPTTSRSSVRLDRFREAIIAAHGDKQDKAVAREELIDASSPQRRALQWLADEDEYASLVWSESDLRYYSANSKHIKALLQRYAMAVLFFATGGGDGNWTSSCGFLEPVHECEWYDVLEDDSQLGSECSRNGKWILEIFLDSNNLVGTLPDETTKFLPRLEVLSLSANLLQGHVPTSLGNLTKLVYLSLHDNELTGIIPAAIANLKSLQYLWLDENLLTGQIPSSLGSLSELLTLNLELNSLTGKIPEELGNLSKLEQIHLGGNSLTGPIPKSIGRLSCLKYLELYRNALSGTIPPSVNNLSQLEYLSMGDNIFSSSLPFTTGSLPSLQWMYLFENHLTGTIPEAIYTYTNLLDMQLSSNNLTGTISPNIANLTKLQMLYLGDTKLTGSFPLALTELGALEQLGLYDNYVALTKMGALEKLYLRGNRFFGTLPSEIGALQNLTQLYLFGNEFTGTLPDALGNLTSLEILALGDNSFSGTVPWSFARLTSLTFLALHRNDFEVDLNVMCDIFDSVKKFVSADCHGDETEVVCDCCNTCCSDTDRTGPINGCFPV